MKHLRTISLLVLATALSVLALTLHTTSSRAGSQAVNATVPCAGSAPVAYKHIVILVMENHDFVQVNGHSPYLNGLAKKCSLATNHTNLGHPSLPNYLRLTAGTNGGITNDCETCSTSVASIFGQLGATGGWKAYLEGMPSTGFLGSSYSAGKYRKKHNPASYFLPVRSAYATRGVPMGSTTSGALRTDLLNGTLPRYSFLTPNMCNDEHDCSLTTGDAWLAKWVPLILNGKNYTTGDTLLVVTYDESEATNKIYTTFVAPSVVPGTVSSFNFNHYSLLRVAESELGLPLLAGARTAPDPRVAFHL